MSGHFSEARTFKLRDLCASTDAIEQDDCNPIVKAVSDLVLANERLSHELGEAKATVKVNFGEGGRKHQGIEINTDAKRSLSLQIVDLCEAYNCIVKPVVDLTELNKKLSIELSTARCTIKAFFGEGRLGHQGIEIDASRDRSLSDQISDLCKAYDKKIAELKNRSQ